MSFQEKRTLVNLVSSLLISLFYSLVMRKRYPAEAEPYSPTIFAYWGRVFAFMIPVSIVARIFVEIFFVITNTIVTREEAPGMTDERDELIELKSSRVALFAFISGFFAAMLSLLFKGTPSRMFSILFGAGLAAEVTSDLAQFLHYRRGV